jgi:hypothetical protein
MGVFSFVNHGIVVFALGGLAPERALISSVFINAVIICRYFFLWGAYLTKKPIIFNLFVPVGMAFMLLLNLHFFRLHKAYAYSVDERIAYCKKNDLELIVVTPLKNSGLLYNSEITHNPNHFKNQHFKNGLFLKHDVVLDSSFD